jgi:hypothetical protein
LGLYIGWVSWIHAFSGREIIALDPYSLFNLIHEISIRGAWSIKKTTPTGIVLYIVWAIEAIIIVGAAGATALLSSDSPYCEMCKKWVETKDTITRLEPILKKDELISKLEQGNFESLKSLNKLENTERAVVRHFANG